MLNLFCGYDAREVSGYQVFIRSVTNNTTEGVCIRRVTDGVQIGSNAFTFGRFLIPHSMGYQGMALFMDACDMLVTEDIAELAACYDPRFAVQCVKHPEYKTQHKFKYCGTEMECANLDYPRKNWASVMLINCEHPSWRQITPHSMQALPKTDLLGLKWLPDDEIGELPKAWNRLVDEGQPTSYAKLLHWTAGSPMFPKYRNAPGAALWRMYRKGIK